MTTKRHPGGILKMIYDLWHRSLIHISSSKSPFFSVVPALGLSPHSPASHAGRAKVEAAAGLPPVRRAQAQHWTRVPLSWPAVPPSKVFIRSILKWHYLKRKTGQLTGNTC